MPDLSVGGIDETDAPDVAHVGGRGHLLIGDNAGIDRIGGVIGIVRAAGEDHVFLRTGDEVDAEIVFARQPPLEVDAGLVPHEDDFGSRRSAKAQRRGALTFEGAHVMLFFAGLLIADIQMVHGVGAQVERIDVTGGVFGAVGIARIMHGGGMKMTVAGEERKSLQGGKGREGIGDGLAHAGG